jgi:ATP-binding cassette subfamily F protein 3
MLSGAEAPDAGTRHEGHQVVVEYFAQDEATRLDPHLTVYETLQAGSPMNMVPMIRNILGGFLFAGDDVYKKAGVLSGGERTRLAVARMLLRPSNTLLLDEPTNHLDLDSKDVLLDALADYGGTLIFVSHDRYFVERLATRIVEVGDGQALMFPGTYEEFLWRRDHPEAAATASRSGPEPAKPRAPARKIAAPVPPTHAGRKQHISEERRRDRELRARRDRIAELEARIADHESAIREIEASMSAPGFYDDRQAAQPLIDRHQSLMWQVGELMQQWEALCEIVDAGLAAEK